MDDLTDQRTRAAIPEFHVTFTDQPDNDVQVLVYHQLGIVADVHRRHLGRQSAPQTIIITTSVPALVRHAIGRTKGRGAERAFEKVIDGLIGDDATIAMQDHELEITIVWDKAAVGDSARAALEFTRTDWTHMQHGLTFHWNQATGHWTAVSSHHAEDKGEPEQTKDVD